MRHHGPVRSAAVAGVLFLLAACSPTGSHHHARGHAHAPLPGPSATPNVVTGRAPVVWVSGQIVSIQPSRLTIVEASGARLVVRRLAEGATAFFSGGGGSWAPLGEGGVAAIRAGTAACAQVLRDRGVYLAVRVFVGAACGPVR